MKEIKNEIITQFYDLSTQKEIKISDIMNFMLLGTTDKIWLPQYGFVKTFNADIDSIINKNYELDLSSLNEDMEKLKKLK